MADKPPTDEWPDIFERPPRAASPPADTQAAPSDPGEVAYRGSVLPFTMYKSGKIDPFDLGSGLTAPLVRAGRLAHGVATGEVPLDRESIANNPATQNAIADFATLGIGSNPYAKSADLYPRTRPFKNFVGAPTDAELRQSATGQITPLTTQPGPYHQRADLRNVARQAEVEMGLGRVPISPETATALAELQRRATPGSPQFKTISTMDLTNMRRGLPDDASAQILGQHLEKFMGSRGTAPPPPTKVYDAGQAFAGGFGDLAAAERAAAIAGTPAPPSLISGLASAAGNRMAYGGIGSRLGAAVTAGTSAHMMGAPPWVSVPVAIGAGYYAPRLAPVAGAGAGAARTLGPDVAEAVLARQRSPLFLDQANSGAREFINTRRDLALELAKQNAMPLARDAAHSPDPRGNALGRAWNTIGGDRLFPPNTSDPNSL